MLSGVFSSMDKSTQILHFRVPLGDSPGHFAPFLVFSAESPAYFAPSSKFLAKYLRPPLDIPGRM